MRSRRVSISAMKIAKEMEILKITCSKLNIQKAVLSSLLFS
jgi:hypothetical protein